MSDTQMKYGIVKSVTDPLKLGRVKVNVFDSHDNIEEKDLPWSQVMMPANTPAINGIGSSANLMIGTLVAGEFLDGAKQEFIVTGTLPTKTNGVADNSQRLGQVTKVDDTTGVEVAVNPHADEPIAEYQPVSAFKPVYPHNNVTEYESGHIKEYDDTPGHERILERHMSGTHYELSPNGSKTEVITRDNYRLVVGHDTLEVYGNVKVIISGHADVAVAGNLTASVAGNIAAESKGNITLKARETDKKITLDGNVDITENLTVAKDVAITGDVVTLGTTTTSATQVIDGHNHTHGDPAGNTSNLS
jgi:hypothetical protein